MPFPDSPREIYERNPIREVIAQLRFPTILQVAAETPASFQDHVRDQYPIYRLESPMEAFPKQVSELASMLAIHGSLAPTHRFLADNESRTISIAPEFLALSESEYKRWEDFRPELERAEAAFKEIYRPNYYSRIGLRYQDVIDKDELGLKDSQWVDLLNPALIGLLGIEYLTEEVQDAQTESLIRVKEVEDGSVRLRHGLRSTPEGRTVYLIDMDLFTSERRDTDGAFGVLDAFNQVAGRIFRWSITGTLRSALGASPRPESG